MRQIDVVTSDLKRITAHSMYLETAKNDLQAGLVEKLQELDATNRDKRINELQLAEAKAENEMLYKSEERVKRLLEDADELRSQLRQKDRDITTLNDRLTKLGDQLIDHQRESKLRDYDSNDRKCQRESDERVILQMQTKQTTLEEKLLNAILHSKELEGVIQAGGVRIEQAVKESDEAKQEAQIKEKENRELLGHISRMRGKQNEQSIVIEKLNNQSRDSDVVVR